jgi:3'(2'), 5'-bisphosphate nucleotidase
MNTDLLQKLLPPVRDAAVRAAAAIQEVAASRQLDVEYKEDDSPLTRADRASHKLIAAALAKLDPPFPLLSEEGDAPGLSDAEAFWLVDPLDGTKEFVKGLGEYTVNIALIENHRPVLGVIQVPAGGVIYHAAEGLGAFRIEGDGEPERIHAGGAERPQTAVVSRSHLDDRTKAYLEHLGVEDMIRHGSSLKMCAVAKGAADIYPRFGPTWLWDTAAGMSIATEAGCSVVDLDGDPLVYNPAAAMKHYGFIICPEAMLSLAMEAREAAGNGQ